MRLIFTLLAALPLLLSACKSASKSYQSGDYADAIELGLRQLRKDPSDAATLDIVQQAYRLAVADREARIRQLSAGAGEERYEKIYREYLRLQDLYTTLQGAPAVARAVHPTDYADYVATYRERTAGVYIDQAEARIRRGTRPDLQAAYHSLNSALRYRPRDGALEARRDSVFSAAQVHIVVLPLQAATPYGGTYQQHNYLLQQFETEVLRSLTYSNSSPFVKFHSEWEARGRNLVPDQVLEISLARMGIGQPYDERSTREASQRVLVRETVYKPDSVVKEYATVRARVTTTHRTVLSEAELWFTVRDLEGRPLWNDRVRGRHQWQTRFATYTGDERALSDADRAALNGGRNLPPREEDVVEDILRQLQQGLSQRMQDYARRL
jgi:hypothetical protein